MTREEARKWLPIIQAFANGKTVELCCDGGATWTIDDEPSFKLDRDYRIKSEPKYRPFKNAEECWAEMLKHQPFGWIKEKATQAMSLVSGVSPLTDNIKLDLLDIAVYSMYSIVTFADGAPFGIKEE